MADIVLNVDVRARTGKGGARETRRAGRVPGVLYGGDRGPVAISLELRQLTKALSSGKFLAHTIRIDHKGEQQTVFAQDVQFHPVTDVPLHVDLYRVEEDQLIKVDVPVRVVGEDVSPGIKRGGTLNLVRHTVELLAPAGAIPEELVIDASALEIGDVVKISSVTLPANVTPTITDRDFTIATVQGRGGKDEAAEAAPADGAAEG
jgi:large subunit ribosomal protein L25